MTSLSWVTVVWSMIASASLTLAAIYWVVWLRNRHAWAHLLFSMTAGSLPFFAYCELWLMRAESPEELLEALKFGQLAVAFLLVSLTWFVAIYLHAGRRWMAWTATGMRVAFALLTFFGEQNTNFIEIPSVRRIQFLGESVSILRGVPNPLMLLGQLSAVLLLIFVADASIGAWRRGDRRRALMVGGSTEFFLLTALVTSAAVFWGYLEAPIVFSLLYLALVAVMGYELSTEVLRASELVHELQASNKQISELFGRLIAAQESERTRIARDLHDDVSQRIAGLSIMISGIKRTLRGEPDQADARRALTSLQENTRALAEEIRHLSHDLHPGLLQHAGLVAALGAFCEEFQKLQAIELTYSADADLARIEGDTALCLYRIAQEGLRNVVKHADARNVSVSLTRTSDKLQLSIVDDGKGFDPGRGRGTGGLGLVSIDERVRLLRGSVRFEMQPPHGTRLQVEIPWPAEIGVTPAASGNPPSAR